MESSICQTDFVVSLIILEKISGLMLPVTRALQTVGADLVEAMRLISHLLTALNNLRNVVSFYNLWEQSVFVADQILDMTLKKPRTLSRSVYRLNAEAEDDTAESYYLVNFFYPTLEKVIEDIQLRFGPQQQSRDTKHAEILRRQQW